MLKNIYISGFADEIAPMLDDQLPVVKDLGMEYICLRAADGMPVAEYTPEDFREKLLPRLQKAGVRLSSLGSPIGKIDIDDEEAFQKQLVQLENLCKICNLTDCRYIRMFSFWMPAGLDPEQFRPKAVKKLRTFLDIAEKYGVVLIHENEKNIYGDTAHRCKILFEQLQSPCFKAAFDFANFVQCGEDPEKCWELLKEHVAYIHIKDAVFGKGENVVCGTGDGKIVQILGKAICRDGYEGFLTLEPHLVLFDTLQSLEIEDARNVISKDKAKNGAEGYAMQYQALVDILQKIENKGE